MAPRANWKGFLKIDELTCPVALYTSVSTSERLAFHMINRATGHRVARQFIDQETGETVAPEAQVKSYEAGDGEFVVLEPEEIAAALPKSDKTLTVECFVCLDDFDDVFLDRPYYLAPSDSSGEAVFSLVREALRKKNAGALAQAVLFRRARHVFIRAKDAGLIATTLHFDYEVRAAEDAFHEIPEMTIKGEMLDLAKHIIATKSGRFDPASFADRYEAALVNLVRAKSEGKPIATQKKQAPAKILDLMEALRKSAQQKLSSGTRASAKLESAKRKAGQAKRKPARKPKAPSNTARCRKAG